MWFIGTFVAAILSTCVTSAVQGAAPEIALQKEWNPSRSSENGAIEEFLQRIIQTAQSLESLPSAPSFPAPKTDLSLPQPSPSINLNSNKAECLRSLYGGPFTTIPTLDSHLMRQPGDTPMMGFKHVLAAVFGAALLAGPASADQASDMNKTVEKLEASVKKLQDIEKGLTDYKLSNATAVRQLQDDVESLKVRIRQLEDETKLLRAPSITSKRESYDTSSKMGRVRLSNEYLEEMSVVVNGVSYRLLPGQTRTIQVPPGTFTYQILQLQRTIQERAIEPGEEKPIRIFTQR